MATTTAAQQWADELGAWRIDDEILSAAPESPYGFPPELFAVGARSESAPSPSQLRAREVLPADGSVLDVGCGGGVASLALVPPAAGVTGVDESADMLALYAAEATRRGVQHREVNGRWPDVADEVGLADVVVCHHVAYNVADLVPFVRALTAHARQRVVLELTVTHPWTGMRELWRHFHHQDRPAGPTADLAADVIREAGFGVTMERWRRSPHGAGVQRDVLVAFARRRLCLPYEREPEVDEAIGETVPWGTDEVAALWWDA